MSLCDNCRLPGRCCIGFDLQHYNLNSLEKPEEVVAALAGLVSANNLRGGPDTVFNAGPDVEQKFADDGFTNIRRGLPFQPLMKLKSGVWRFWCPVLDIKTGRCGDYENRPALCRHYQPGKDALCAEYVPPAPREELPDDVRETAKVT